MRADSISSTSIYRENTTAHFIGSMERAHKCWVWTQIRDITQPCQQFHPHQERFCIEMTMNLPGSLSYVCCFILVMFSNMLLPVEHYPPVNPSCHKHVAVAHHTHLVGWSSCATAPKNKPLMASYAFAGNIMLSHHYVFFHTEYPIFVNVRIELCFFHSDVDVNISNAWTGGKLCQFQLTHSRAHV